MAESSENSVVHTEEHDGTNSRDVLEPQCGTSDPAVTVPRGLWTTNHERRKKIVLHIDLNNTILVSDAVTSQGTVAALDSFLTTVTWGKMNKHVRGYSTAIVPVQSQEHTEFLLKLLTSPEHRGKWEWLSDSPSLLPQCSDAVSYYSQFGRTPDFTSTAGRRFRGVLEEHLNLLRWPEGAKEDRELTLKGEDGRLYHWILPSFFQLLKDLVQEGMEFAILFRTFGSDLPRVLRAVFKALNEGTHPLFPDLPDLKLSVNMNAGKIRCSKRGTVLSRAEDRVSTSGGERDLYQYLSSVQGLGGFQDHYDWWVRNTYSILGGKPLWVDPFDQTVQHIFIDDNIRQNDEDTIVHPKVFLDPDSSETRTASTSELYDITLVQTDLLRAISDPNYFTSRVHICLENYDRNIQQGAG